VRGARPDVFDPVADLQRRLLDHVSPRGLRERQGSFRRGDEPGRHGGRDFLQGSAAAAAGGLRCWCADRGHTC
jgi:hypothetical protein